jgi:hypothetical protein
MPYWYHKECFFKKQKPKALGDIAKLDSIRVEDQDYIKSQIENSSNGNGSTPEGTVLISIPVELYLNQFNFLQPVTRKRRRQNGRAVASNEKNGVVSTLRPAVLSALGANRKSSRMKSDWPKWITKQKKPCALVEFLVGITLIASFSAESTMNFGIVWTSFLASWVSLLMTRKWSRANCLQ